MHPIPKSLLALSLCAGLAQAADQSLFPENQPLTAERLERAVLERNPGLASLRAAVEAAGERVPQAAALDDPMLMTKLAPSTLGDSSSAYMLELSQRLPWPGKREARKVLALRERDAMAADESALRLVLAAQVRGLFAEYRFATEALAVNARNRALWRDLRAVAEGLYRAGRARRQDALAAALAAQGLERERLVRERELIALKASLNRLLDRVPGESLPAPEAPALPARLPDAELLQERALRQHPVLAGHASKIEVAEQALRLAELNDYPDFEVRAGYDRFEEAAPMRGSLGLSINIPIGGDRAAGKREARAQARSAQWTLNEQRNQLREAVATDLAAVQQAVASLRLQRHELLPLARENLDAALAEYRAGSGEFLRVAEAQRQVAENELAAVEAEAMLLRAWAALERDSGGAPVVAEVVELTR